jgi:5-hydroxyisourate hydrolase
MAAYPISWQTTSACPRVVFEIEDYFRESGRTCFYPFIPVVFEIQDGVDYHVPLLVGIDSYSTHRA